MWKAAHVMSGKPPCGQFRCVRKPRQCGRCRCRQQRIGVHAARCGFVAIRCQWRLRVIIRAARVQIGIVCGIGCGIGLCGLRRKSRLRPERTRRMHGQAQAQQREQDRAKHR